MSGIDELNDEEREKVAAIVSKMRDAVVIGGRKELEKEFSSLDKNSDGYLDENESKRMLDILNLYEINNTPLTDQELSELKSAFDFNNDGKLDFDEYLNLIADRISKIMEKIIIAKKLYIELD